MGNFGSDPLFADNEYHLKSSYGRWDGKSWVNDNITSPCIDKGDPKDRYFKEPQPNGGQINIGLYGNNKFASKGSINGKEGFVESLCNYNDISMV